MSRFTIAALLATALCAAGCGNDSNTPTTPTPTPTQLTDTFNGTLTRNGASNFSFNVNAAGTVYLTLTSVADSSAVVGLSLGIWNATTATCTVVLSNDAAIQGATITGSATGVGQLCARVFDVGKVVDPLDYQLTVLHY